VNSIAAGIAPLLGGKFADFFGDRQLAWVLTYTSPDGTFTLPTLNLEGWDFFFMFAFLIGLYSLHRLSVVREEGVIADSKATREFLMDFKHHVQDIPLVNFGSMLLGLPFGAIQGLTSKIARKVGYRATHSVHDHV
jgi:hypothetical protein